MKNSIYITTKSPTLLGKATKIVVSVVLIGLGLMFSALLLMVIVTVGAMAWGYLWWKTRDLRKQMRKHPPSEVVVEGDVIEGEVVRREVNGISVESETEEIRKFIQARNA